MEKQKNPTAYITFLFGTQMLLCGMILAGMFQGNSDLYYGIYNLACFPVYLQAGKDYMEMGDTLSAALYYMFGTVFAGAMGAIYIAQYFGGVYGWNLEYNFMGAFVLMAGVYLIPIVISAMYMPWTEFLTWLIVDLLCLAMGIMGFVGGALGGILYMAATAFSFISGTLLLYMSIVAVFRAIGMTLPVGKPILKFPEQG